MNTRSAHTRVVFLFVALVALWAPDRGQAQDAADEAHISIGTGSGSFVMDGGPGHRDDTITVYYHKPDGFHSESPIVLVIPGGGRNAWDYRDAWVEASKEHEVLVLSPNYPEDDYGFGQYHMAGLVAETNAVKIAEFVEHSHQVKLDEERARFVVNPTKREWIFDDFDRLFEMAAKAVGSSREGYDLFGHSAGGQILHRLVLLDPDTEADRIVAANSGFYTMPDLDGEVPFGLKGAPVRQKDLHASFRQPLVLLLGSEDDHPESGGVFLRSSSADAQGMGRLQRGNSFFERGKEKADEIGADFNWKLEVVPGVGHDYEGMSEAAAEYLYGDR